jgi:exo-beta-1,3-glucanase (GH17 family)/cellulose synthase/poly-beta-1,6-N-acetylglucosamine synthase-like glycosyltransferase
LDRSSLLLSLVIGLLIVLMWAFLNQPEEEVPWPQTIQGFSYSPMRAEHDPEKKRYPTEEQILDDMQLLSGTAYAVRTYQAGGIYGKIPALAKEAGLNVAVGAWIGKNEQENQREIEALKQVYLDNIGNIVRVIVGNEAILRNDRTPEEIIRYLDSLQSEISAPISTAEPWHIWLKYPELANHVDYLAVHFLPYWENQAVDNAIDFIVLKYNELQQAFPGKPIVITEVGWPSRGRTRGPAVASVANQAKFLRRFLDLAERENYTYYIIEAFDQVWKKSIEGEVGSAWGVYRADRTPKYVFTGDIVQVPHWRVLAGVTMGIAIILLALLLRDSQGLGRRGRWFLVLVTYLVVSVTVWIVYDFTERYLSLGTLLYAVLIMLAATGVCIVLLAEAHEWAEALWLKQWRRMPDFSKSLREYHPKVSIHVPAYNEPPDMLVETLDHLARVEYPDFEVIVIDNNTTDPAVWEPVRDHCEKLGERFRFYHVAPLSGFKAGALNFALENTDPDAEVIAVIDSDYQVRPEWLGEMVPGFADPEVAIMQAPQDYRDGNENLFKAMCYQEYRGFFHVGMVTRNERNAIIQHGTMTMMRRTVLEEVGGWGEWCITEDAELGLRIFERGYKAFYVPRSYGKGLIPDTFLDFKKQRFRWAYGAVLILRQHVSQILSRGKNKLTFGQRYHFLAGWLPWFADGVNLLFTLGAILWTLLMLAYPQEFAPPELLFSLLPLSFFVFKMMKMLVLYRWRVGATLMQSLAAGLAGLALSHTIARAMIAGFITDKIGFFRTPKRAKTNRLLAALNASREEALFMTALLLSAIAVLYRHDADMLDTRVWALVLFIQAGVYSASVLMASISAFPGIGSGIVRQIEEEPVVQDAG